MRELVDEWREANYACDFPALTEILLYQRDGAGNLLFLREPQFQALETYWYLRTQLNTPKFLELYKVLYQKSSERLNALGVDIEQDLLDFIKDEDEYLAHIAKRSQYGTLAESLSLEYASYVFALTMGAGKTVLIGAIIASEFAISLDTRDDRFMKNALVFAPGKTIIESLKEISIIPYDKILPPRHAKKFITNVKLIYTRDGDKDIQAQEGGSYNLIVTNTEKIALRKKSIRRGQTKFDFENQLAHDALVANQRLNKIASLPSLGVFSDEAHHTYGSLLMDDLKRVRETINHLHKQTQLVCVVNTTGTPYSGAQTLKDVVFWYGLDQGIRDNVLKSLAHSINSYTFADQALDSILEDVINDFFSKYRDTKLVTGQKAKIAFYFKNQEHLEESRLIIERSLVAIGESPSLILVNTQRSSKKDIDDFNRLNDPDATKRIILLIDKGVEGWNCPSLFATALIRELASSNNFVLQASTRCLRQVDGNNLPATIYVEKHNQLILNKELQKTFGTSLIDLKNIEPKKKEINLIFRKTLYPKLEIVRTVQRVVSKNRNDREILLTKPRTNIINKYTKEQYSPISEKSGVMLSNTGMESTIVATEDMVDIFTASKRVADNYHLKTERIFRKLKLIYDDDVPQEHIAQLFLQVEQQTASYEVVEERVVEALMLIRFVDGNGEATFNKNHSGTYYHTVRYDFGKEKLLARREDFSARNSGDFGFHYDPYYFDSEPEKEFFVEMLERLGQKKDEVEDIYFTGGITNSRQTDFHFEYKGEDGRHHQYYPDFVILKKSGEFLIVEVKAENKQNDLEVLAKKRAVEQLADMPGNKFGYHILYTDVPIPTTRLTDTLRKVESL